MDKQKNQRPQAAKKPENCKNQKPCKGDDCNDK